MLLYHILLSFSISSTFSGKSLQVLFEQYFKWKLRTYPEWATKIGFNDYNGRSEDFTFKAIRGKARTCKNFLKRSHYISTENEELRTYQSIMEVHRFILKDYALKYEGKVCSLITRDNRRQSPT